MKELLSRYVFVDTSVYESKNFQFHSHTLGHFKDLCVDRKIFLLNSDIINNEVTSHLKVKSAEAAKHIKDFKSTIRILRNLPDIPQYSIFKTITKDEIENDLLKKYDEYVDEAVYENVDIDTVLPSSVIQSYFMKTPPFSMKKKDEFPDAIILHSLDAWAKSKNETIYVLSNDSDMENFCENNERLHHVGNLEGFIDLVIKSEEELKEPSAFAFVIFDENRNEITERIHGLLESIEFISESMDWNGEISDVAIDKVEIVEINLLDVSRDDSLFDVKVKFEIDAWHTLTDLDRSIWDSEDKKYIFEATTSYRCLHEVNCSISLKLYYEDGLRKNLEIYDLELDTNTFSLNVEDGEEIEREEHNLFE